jgi:hypothetical protein
MELNFYIREDKLRVKEGLKPKYELPAMEANIERHHTNIKMFEEKMKQEDETIVRIKGMISVLEEDMKPPKEIIIDMRPSKELPFRKKKPLI